MMTAATGTLWLVPNALDFGTDQGDLLDALPLGVLKQAAVLQHWVVEDARSARLFLKRVAVHVPLSAALQTLDVRELPRPPKGQKPTVQALALDAADWLRPALAGLDMGLLSEAGLPAVADPGALLVQAAHRSSVVVRALPGTSAITLAVAASGLNGQSFSFLGYLPVDAADRAARIKALDILSRQARQTQVVIETPYRNTALLHALLAALAPTTQLCVASGLTWPGGFTRTQSVAAWRLGGTELDKHMPTVFLWLAN